MPPPPSHTTTTGSTDAGHQVLPCGAGLAPGHVPAEHVPVPVGDEHDRIAAQVDAVEVHHVMDLPVHRARRPQAPTQPIPAPERPVGDRRIPLRFSGQQPIEEALHILGATIVGVGDAGAAAALAVKQGIDVRAVDGRKLDLFPAK